MKRRPTEPKALKATRKAGVVFFIASVILFLVSWARFQSGNPITGFLFLISGLIAAKGAWDAGFQGIVLHSDELEFGAFLSKQKIKKVDIEDVTWAKGCGVSVKVREKGWQRIPDLHNAQRVSASIRAWLKT